MHKPYGWATFLRESARLPKLKVVGFPLGIAETLGEPLKNPPMFDIASMDKKKIILNRFLINLINH